jgi:Amt family ammonium transporter
VGGILGALATGVLGHASLGGVATFESIGTQLGIQATGVAITVVWSAVVTAVAFYLIKFTIGLRPNEDVEREGLDTNEHGERAYDA